MDGVVVEVGDILDKTRLLEFLAEILAISQNTEFTRYLQLEATWILTNLAFGRESDLLSILDQKYGILTNVTNFLDGDDLQMIDLVLKLISNICGESLALRNLVLTETMIIKCLQQTLHKTQNEVSEYYCLHESIFWCLTNICRSNKTDFNTVESNFHLSCEYSDVALTPQE